MMRRCHTAARLRREQEQSRPEAFAAVMAQVGDQVDDASPFAAQRTRQDTLDLFQIVDNRAEHVYRDRDRVLNGRQQLVHDPSPLGDNAGVTRKDVVLNFQSKMNTTRRGSECQSARWKLPLRPPLFSSSRMRSMVMLRSTALHMS